MRLALRSSALLLVASFTLALAGRAEQLPEQSPFLPPGGTPAKSTAAADGFELVGMTSFGRETLISILRQADQRSLWIPLGRTMSEITAVSYDPAKDEAVIRVGGRTLTLPMRKGSVVTGLDTPLPAPMTLPASAVSAPAPGAPSRPLTPTEEKEMEARMLVSDLLEIGQQQRKAYAEAQRQAAAKAAAAKAKPSPPPPSSAATAAKK
ncbi:hypothetical protein [Opitutus terrae]|uniref:hypothetical protein n=1 Tax=Opitutus terrae TaxID=107709 RepID=UPI0002D7DCEC|nr:hypothetical protein [Opitutus terrae]